jgi:hypothetical protein
MTSELRFPTKKRNSGGLYFREHPICTLMVVLFDCASLEFLGVALLILLRRVLSYLGVRRPSAIGASARARPVLVLFGRLSRLV